MKAIISCVFLSAFVACSSHKDAETAEHIELPAKSAPKHGIRKDLSYKTTQPQGETVEEFVKKDKSNGYDPGNPVNPDYRPDAYKSMPVIPNSN